MMTKFTIYWVGREPETRVAGMPEKPGYLELARLIRPILDGKHMEHVTVLHQGRRADMFIDEGSAVDDLPRNEAATAIYRTIGMADHPSWDADEFPAIYGTAVLFDRRVWW